MVTICLHSLSLLCEEDLLLKFCLAYGVSGLLLLDRCLWGDWLWVRCVSPAWVSVPAGVPVHAGVS